MRIVSPTEIQRVAWEGTLEPLGAAFKDATPLPRVTLGEPAWWPPGEALEARTGKAWSPPAGDRRYALVRLTCNLHPPPKGSPAAGRTPANDDQVKKVTIFQLQKIFQSAHVRLQISILNFSGTQKTESRFKSSRLSDDEFGSRKSLSIKGRCSFGKTFFMKTVFSS